MRVSWCSAGGSPVGVGHLDDERDCPPPTAPRGRSRAGGRTTRPPGLLHGVLIGAVSGRSAARCDRWSIGLERCPDGGEHPGAVVHHLGQVKRSTRQPSAASALSRLLVPRGSGCQRAPSTSTTSRAAAKQKSTRRTGTARRTTCVAKPSRPASSIRTRCTDSSTDPHSGSQPSKTRPARAAARRPGSRATACAQVVERDVAARSALSATTVASSRGSASAQSRTVCTAVVTGRGASPGSGTRSTRGRARLTDADAQRRAVVPVRDDDLDRAPRLVQQPPAAQHRGGPSGGQRRRARARAAPPGRPGRRPGRHRGR